MRILCMGESLLRFSTKKGQRFSALDFQLHVGGAEGNVACALASWGNETHYLTVVSKHPIGDAIIQHYHQYGVQTDQILRCEERMGTYYLETGSGSRASQVIYDRAHSGFSLLKKEDVCIENVLKDVDMFIVSGISVALSKDLETLILDMMVYCQQHHIKVAYDMNYRAKLWTVEEAGKAFKRILPYVNYLSAGVLDARNFLKLETEKEESLKDFYDQIQVLYPNIEAIFSTQRVIRSSNRHQLIGYLYIKSHLYTSPCFEVEDIVDRIGTGDAFFSGIIHGMIHSWDNQDIVDYATASAVLKHSIEGDAQNMRVEEIKQFLSQGVGRVQR